MLPKKLAALLSSFALLHGPIVLFNTDKARCDALILLPTREIILVPLPKLSRSVAEKLCRHWLFYLRHQGVRERAVQPAYGRRGVVPPERVLSLLWTWVVHPVLETLGLDRIVSHYA